MPRSPLRNPTSSRPPAAARALPRSASSGASRPTKRSAGTGRPGVNGLVSGFVIGASLPPVLVGLLGGHREGDGFVLAEEPVVLVHVPAAG